MLVNISISSSLKMPLLLYAPTAKERSSVALLLIYISVGLLSGNMGRGRTLYLSSNTLNLVGP
jgi:hypothetical protein